MIREGNFIVIQSFMVTDLELKGDELLIYAIIYGFSQDGNQHFTGLLRYLADWTGCTFQEVIKALKSLQNKGFIKREEVFNNGVNKIEYWCA